LARNGLWRPWRPKVGKSKVMMERWSRKYDWCGRVAAHVGYVADVERLAIEGLAREKAIKWDKVHEDQRIAEWTARNRLVKLAERSSPGGIRTRPRRALWKGSRGCWNWPASWGGWPAGWTGNGVDGVGKAGPAVRVEVSLALDKIYGEPLPGEVVEVTATPHPGPLPAGEGRKLLGEAAAGKEVGR